MRLLVGTSPGGVTDYIARQVAERVGKRLHQPVVVENRPGALELVAINAVAEANPDGYTMLWMSSGFSSLSLLTKSFTYDVLKDFAPVSLVVTIPVLIVGHVSAPYRTIDELVSYMRANPGKANWAYNGGGSYLAYALFQSVTRTNFEMIRYSGQAGINTALLGGEQLVARTTIDVAKTIVDSGKVRILGVLTPMRHPLIPNVPSLGESSLPELRELAAVTNHQRSWFGVAAPGRVPPDVISQWSRALVDLGRDPDFGNAVRMQGAVPIGSTPDEFSALISKEFEIWRGVAKQIDLQPQ